MSPFVMKNCNLINGRVSSGIQKSVSILINKSGLIEKIADNGKAMENNVDTVIDLNGSWVMPGLINSHAHLIASGKPSIGDNRSTRFLLKFLSTGAGKALALGIIKKNIKNAVNAGVTTIRSLGDPLYFDIAVRDSLKKSSEPFPRLIVAGKLLCATGGHGDMLTPITADSPWDLRKAVRLNDRYGVDLIKLISTGGVTDARKVGEAGRVHMTVEEITAVCDEAHRRGLMVAAHAESSLGVKEALLGGVDTIEHGAEFDAQILDLFLNNPKSLRGFSAYIPTLSAPIRILDNIELIKSFDDIKKKNAEIVMEGQIKAVRQAVDAGVKLGCGADSGVPFVTHYDVWYELKLLMEKAGISAAEAIEIGTIASAEILDIDKLTGSLDVGKSADIIVTAENPLENIEALSNLEMVVAAGRLIRKPRVKAAY